ncbi:hypothetical protein BGW41_000334 [Actinomortierella wolfii]|nr:hypothetical protein BGW41_000334 [Actinomortierella wolfii]
MLETPLPTEKPAIVENHLLLVGNPGVGKSYLLNSLGGHFASGFSAVDGLTSQCTHSDVYIESESSYVRLVDVPGLLETNGPRMKENGRAIAEALRKKGKFKLVFVLAESSGRVHPADLYTIGKVMKAVDYAVDVGLVINKVPDDEMEYYQEADIKSIIEQLNTVANGKFHSSRCVMVPRLPKSQNSTAGDYLRCLLSKIDGYNDIPNVRDIFATDHELNEFGELIASGPRAIKQRLIALFNGVASHIGATPQQTSIGHSDAISQHTNAPMQQPEQEQPEPQETGINTLSPQHSDRDKDGIAEASLSGDRCGTEQIARQSVDCSSLEAVLNVDERHKNSTACKNPELEKGDTNTGQSVYGKPQLNAIEI